jgi:hypothetical protein
MDNGKSFALRLKTAARLQDAIRSLGKYKRGNKEMTEAIKKAEELVEDLVDGRKPLITGLRTSYLLMSIAAHNNSNCRLMEYGLHEESKAAVRGMLQRAKEREDSR